MITLNFSSYKATFFSILQGLVMLLMISASCRKYPINTTPLVNTFSIGAITQQTATGGGEVVLDGGTTVTDRGVCWSLNSSPEITDPHTSDGTGIGQFVSGLTGMTPNNLYYIRAYASNSNGTSYGSTLSFNTLAYGIPCPGTATVTYGSKTYNTLLIGTQCWLKENLDIGVMIDGSLDQHPYDTVIEKYCYNNDSDFCNIYGGLYQWDEMMQGNITGTIVQGICPAGWHIPTENDWDNLIGYLGGNGDAGGTMKESGNTHWDSPNTGANNCSFFTALPGGGRDFTPPYFAYLNKFCYYWSSSWHTNTNLAHRYYMSYAYDDILKDTATKEWGLSVRCIKD